ncbi:MAG: S-methyl-5-thioribose-1-phosphate isomerase [Anaerolineaceae bacterium]
MSAYQSVAWVDGKVRLLDQRRLPHEVVYIDYSDYNELANAILDMVVRGAPAIGVTGAYGLALAAWHCPAGAAPDLITYLEKAAKNLRAARPTAVNLSYGVDRLMNLAREHTGDNIHSIRELLLAEADAVCEEDRRICRSIGQNALPLVPQHAAFIHHCNTGALCAIEYGTALGIIQTAHENGREVFVYVDETRPRLQGARLTTWELKQLGIPHAVIVDGASGYIMHDRHVDLVTVGCDRVAANGDAANKIGTYNLAIVARAHNVPFYVAAPTTTIDLAIKNGSFIEIEKRSAIEITTIGGEQITPPSTAAVNPAFDVTPAEYITAIITEEGIARPPYEESLAEMVAKAEAHRAAGR